AAAGDLRDGLRARPGGVLGDLADGHLLVLVRDVADAPVRARVQRSRPLRRVGGTHRREPMRAPVGCTHPTYDPVGTLRNTAPRGGTRSERWNGRPACSPGMPQAPPWLPAFEP